MRRAMISSSLMRSSAARVGTVPSSVFAARSLIAAVLLRERPAARKVSSAVARIEFGQKTFPARIKSAHPAKDGRGRFPAQLLIGDRFRQGVEWPNDRLLRFHVEGPRRARSARRISGRSRPGAVPDSTPRLSSDATTSTIAPGDTKSAGSSDAVHVILRVPRKIAIHDPRLPSISGILPAGHFAAMERLRVFGRTFDSAQTHQSKKSICGKPMLVALRLENPA